MTEISDEELELKLRSKWFANCEKPKPTVISIQEKRAAEKLMGADNAARLSRKRDGQRFIFRQPVVTMEYYCYRDKGPREWVWRINMLVNGKMQVFRDGLSPEECREEVDKARDTGLEIKEMDVGGPKLPAKPAVVAPPRRIKPQRRNILDRLRDFRA